jgi:wyosine [tRNA(Phe)-imidazoG37] synthetase (radical SAM superfamily)
MAQSTTSTSSSQTANHPINYVYGPVNSWRYGRSLGIDPIGSVSTCSFDCVYCQLGEIERKTSQRAIYVPTIRILQDLQAFDTQNVDVITLSGSGEPTLAANLEDILRRIKETTGKPTVVLTNGTLLYNERVRQELAIADKVAVKLDASSAEQLRRVNRPVDGLDWETMYQGIQQFRQSYQGQFSLQTMMLADWKPQTKADYIHCIQQLQPDEIQLNTPKRPKPTHHILDARGNHSPASDRPYEVKVLKCVSPEVLQAFAQQIQQQTGVLVRTSHSE